MFPRNPLAKWQKSAHVTVRAGFAIALAGARKDADPIGRVPHDATLICQDCYPSPSSRSGPLQGAGPFFADLAGTRVFPFGVAGDALHSRGITTPEGGRASCVSGISSLRPYWPRAWRAACHPRLNGLSAAPLRGRSSLTPPAEARRAAHSSAQLRAGCPAAFPVFRLATPATDLNRRAGDRAQPTAIKAIRAHRPGGLFVFALGDGRVQGEGPSCSRKS